VLNAIFCAHTQFTGGGAVWVALLYVRFGIWGLNTCVSARSITTLKISINEIGVKIVYWVFGLQIKKDLVGAPTGRDKYYKQSSTYSNKWSRISFHTVQMVYKQLFRESFLLWSIFILTMDPTFSAILCDTYHINTILVQLNCDNIIYILNNWIYNLGIYSN
jgi:hypothetical protein